jgi:hypothetical protein
MATLPYFTSQIPGHYLLEIAKGNIDKHSLVHIYGRNTDIDLAASEDVWDGGGVWVAPTTARVHNIVSDSVNDDGDPVGTGVRTLTIHGLDANYDEISETITMNGTTDVPSVNAYTIIHRMVSVTVGSTGSNVGTITATAVTDATVTCQMNPTNNQSFLGVYQVPANKTAYVISFHSAIMSLVSGVVKTSLLQKPFGAQYLLEHVLGISVLGKDEFIFSYFKAFPAKTTFKMQSTTTVDDKDIFGRLCLLLVG